MEESLDEQLGLGHIDVATRAEVEDEDEARLEAAA